MSVDTANDIEEQARKGQMKVALIIAAVVVAVGLAIWSGVRTQQQQEIKVVGTLGPDGRVNYFKDGKTRSVEPENAGGALPPSKQ